MNRHLVAVPDDTGTAIGRWEQLGLYGDDVPLETGTDATDDTPAEAEALALLAQVHAQMDALFGPLPGRTAQRVAAKLGASGAHLYPVTPGTR